MDIVAAGVIDALTGGDGVHVAIAAVCAAMVAVINRTAAGSGVMNVPTGGAGKPIAFIAAFADMAAKTES